VRFRPDADRRLHASPGAPILADAPRCECDLCRHRHTDPTCYVARTLTGPFDLPRGCSYTIVAPDPNDAQEEFCQMLSTLSAEQNYTGIEVDNIFSESLTISCAAPS